MFRHLYDELLADLVPTDPAVEQFEHRPDYSNDCHAVVDSLYYISRGHFAFGFTRVGLFLKS